MAGERCTRCKVAILESDLAKGLAVLLSGKPYCKICMERVAMKSAQGGLWSWLSRKWLIVIALFVLGLLSFAVLLLIQRSGG